MTAVRMGNDFAKKTYLYLLTVVMTYICRSDVRANFFNTIDHLFHVVLKTKQTNTFLIYLTNEFNMFLQIYHRSFSFTAHDAFYNADPTCRSM